MDPKRSNSLRAYQKKSGSDNTLLRLVPKWEDSRLVVGVPSSELKRSILLAHHDSLRLKTTIFLIQFFKSYPRPSALVFLSKTKQGQAGICD